MIVRPIEILEEIFSNNITVQSISTPTKALQLATARRKCRENNFDVHLVRESIESDLLLYEKATDTTRPLNEKEVITESTPIYDAIEFLKDQPFLFIKEKREIKRIVTKADIDSMPIRIWLFGMISLLEWQLREYILLKNITWENSLSPRRLFETRKLHVLKIENNEEARLIDCTQLIDLSTVIIKNWNSFSMIFSNSSKGSLKSDFVKMTNLRNTLSHSLRMEYNWDQIYHMVRFITRALKNI